MSKYNPNRIFFILALILAAAASGLLYWMQFSLLYAYLICISVVTLLFYGYDKRQAILNNPRIPELLLHMLALFGGTPGAFMGQILFRHKTKKLSFKCVFLMIVLLQAGIGFCCWRYLESSANPTE